MKNFSKVVNKADKRSQQQQISKNKKQALLEKKRFGTIEGAPKTVVCWCPLFILFMLLPLSPPSPPILRPISPVLSSFGRVSKYYHQAMIALGPVEDMEKLQNLLLAHCGVVEWDQQGPCTVGYIMRCVREVIERAGGAVSGGERGERMNGR